MKKTTITCNQCLREIREGQDHIEIGSENEKEFKFKNGFSQKTLGRYDDLHFCSVQHFTEYFVDDVNERPAT